MKKMLKENKGFSLVELLVAILIMAVIAGTAITLFGGVLNSSRESADKETAESIKRAILTYMNLSNDTDLDSLGITSSSYSSDLITKLGMEITIADDDTVSYSKPRSVTDTTISEPDETTRGETSDIAGTHGPFLDLTKDMAPKTPGKAGWKIMVETKMQVVSVEAADVADDAKVTIFDS